MNVAGWSVIGWVSLSIIAWLLLGWACLPAVLRRVYEHDLRQVWGSGVNGESTDENDP